MPTAKLVEQMRKIRERAGDDAPLSRDLEANVERFNRVVGWPQSYDMIFRRFEVAGISVATYVINGFFQTFANVQILSSLASADPGAEGRHRGEGGQAQEGRALEAEGGGRTGGGDRVAFLRNLLQRQLAYSQVSVTASFQEAVLQLLSGPMIILVDGEPSVIVVDTRWYPDRSPDDPLTEQLIDGPRDGFVENIIMNSALVRRRVRDPGIRFELHKVGQRSRTDVAICYIEGLTSPRLVEAVRRRLKEIDVDGIPTAEEAMAEFMGRAPWNPFPTVRTTQRADVVAVNLYDGHVVLIVDTTPVALILPTTFFQMLQHPEDYHVNPVTGTYLRWTEAIAFVAAVLVSPIWLLLATHPGLLHQLPALSFIGEKKPTAIPLALQFILAEVTIDILRRAILNSVPALATTFGILGAVVFGQVATKTGIFSPEALTYLVFAALSSFAISNLQLGMTTRIMRLTLLILEWLWALPGVVIGLLFWLVLAARTESVGVPYLWPLAPFDWPALRSVLIRAPITQPKWRPRVLLPQDRWRA